MLYLIGLGLSDETDITVKGLEIVRKASRVYLEAYTSILLVDKDADRLNIRRDFALGINGYVRARGNHERRLYEPQTQVQGAGIVNWIVAGGRQAVWSQGW